MQCITTASARSPWKLRTCRASSFEFNAASGNQTIQSSANLGAVRVNKTAGSVLTSGALAIATLTLDSGTFAPAAALTISTLADLNGGTYDTTSGATCRRDRCSNRRCHISRCHHIDRR